METIWKDNETDEEVGSPLTGEMVVKILSAVFRLNDKILQKDNLELEYEGANFYTVRPKQHKDFHNLVFKIVDREKLYEVRIVPDFQIKILATCKALGLEVDHGPEGFKDLADYPDLMDDLESTTDTSLWFFLIQKSDLPQ